MSYFSQLCDILIQQNLDIYTSIKDHTYSEEKLFDYLVKSGRAIEQLRFKIDKNVPEARLVGGPEVKSSDNRSVEQRIEEIKRKWQREIEKSKNGVNTWMKKMN